ncbi:hypothetical protein [Dictyobacter arantiisoli]|uniref:Uncharacterized protein n=1 Tax=Dictyobacter arantiisoli TaxID=2014874 RepID=A0A5A5TJV9_9CHLR|nr:hypothetical protein [Dictyobacter arantiisoli]GCF11911.1 hypothetical protein KDI_54750 [Dictyobacter arantiisoli]
MNDLIEDGFEGNYKLMYFALLDYRFEKIGFLEMLDMWENILGIGSSSFGEMKEEENVTDLAS